MEQQQAIEQQHQRAGEIVSLGASLDASTPGLKQAAQAVAQAAPVVAQAALEVAAAIGNPVQRRTARERLAQAQEASRAAKHKPFEPIQTAAGELFIRRLPWPESYRVQLTASQGGDGALDIRHNAADIRALSIVALADCVYSEPNDHAKYFGGLEDAAQFVDSLDVELEREGRRLFDACLYYNPLLLPRNVEGQSVPGRVLVADLEADEAALQQLLQDVPSRPAEAPEASREAPAEVASEPMPEPTSEA